MPVADDITLNAGSGGATVRALVDAAGREHPAGLVEYPTHIGDGTTNDPAVLQVVDLTHGFPVAPLAGENHVGEVGGNSEIISVTPTITAALYAALNNVGGLLTLTNALRPSPNARFTGVLQSILVIDKSNQKAPLDILIFTSQPAATFTDKAAFPTLSLADGQLVRRRISVAAADYVTIGGTAFADITAVGKIIKGAAATIYAAVQVASGGAPTYAGTTDLTLNFGFLRD